MRIRTTALALVMLPAMLTAQASPPQPQCKAERVEGRLMTTAVFPNGYVVEGPWRVINWRAPVAIRPNVVMVAAVLDRIIEFDPFRRERFATPFPAPVELVFEGETEAEVMAAAADVWCSTVKEARSGFGDLRKMPAVNTRIT
jgi:hypothetical protein